ncbi:MAG: helix-turn-helix transcriptional regulator [Desulfuromonadales bacterium]|nr:helix-turn-helix transcriptional regulator [Desulfuromonadales bacterium]
MNSLDIGSKIKKLRQSRKLTLQTVADEVGFSPALISQVENNHVSPPIATLSKIANFFDVKIGYFFTEVEDDSGFEIVHANQRKSLSKLFAPLGATTGYSYEALAYRTKNKKMEPLFLTVSDKTSEEISYSHDGEKFLFVTKGSVELILGDKSITLSEGDSIYFDSSVIHRIRSKNGEEGSLLTIVTR